MAENEIRQDKDQYIRRADREKKPRLYVIHDGKVQEFGLSGHQDFGRQVPGHTPALYSGAYTVSRKHGEFFTSEGRIRFTDIGSTNGTILNDRKLNKGVSEDLKDGSVLRIHAVKSKDTKHDVIMVAALDYPEDTRWNYIPLDSGVNSIDVGRGQEISLRGRTASRKHATFIRAKNGWAIVDNQSLNGVFLNGYRIKAPVLLRPMDVIRIAKHLFVFCEEYLLFQEDSAPERDDRGFTIVDPPSPAGSEEKADNRAERVHASASSEDQKKEDGQRVQKEQEKIRCAAESAGQNVNRCLQQAESLQAEVLPGVDRNEQQTDRPESGAGAPAGERKERSRAARKKGGRTLSIQIVERNVWSRLRKKTILRDINLKIESGSLVLILGGSGAGKTTFMNAVMGYEPAKGRIMYGENDIYREYEKMKYEIGYVPQKDLLRMEDVVYDTLENAARMRLPGQIPDDRRRQIVLNTLEMFGLSRERESIVGKLSGGQRKRLSIAVEYIGNPSLFFLDEPDSGLDAIMARDLMENLREIADQGKTVMVITHSPDRAFELFDCVIVLAKSAADDCGHLVFCGSPSDACAFFGTKTLEGVVGRVNRKDEGGEGLADHFIRKYMQSRRQQ